MSDLQSIIHLAIRLWIVLELEWSMNKPEKDDGDDCGDH